MPSDLPDRHPGGTRQLAFHFIMAVWGDAYTEVFLNTALPNQLTPGNLAAFRQVPGCRYQVFTRRRDVEKLRAHASFRRLTETLATDIIEIDELFTEEILAKPDWFIHIMTGCHVRALGIATRAGAALFFLYPDMLCSDGTFATAARLVRDGKRAIMVTGVRLSQESVVGAVRRYYDDRHGTLAIGPRDLMRIALEHLHPVTQSLFWNSPEFNNCPANVYWRVGAAGILARCLHLHPLVVNPARRDIPPFVSVDGSDFLQHACPDARDVYVSADSDEMLMFGLTSVSRVIGNHGPNRASLAALAAFAATRANVLQRRFALAPIRLHADDLSDEWVKVERRSAVLIRAAVSGRALLGRFVVAGWFCRRELKHARSRTRRKLHALDSYARTIWHRQVQGLRKVVVRVPRRRIRRLQKRLNRAFLRDGPRLVPRNARERAGKAWRRQGKAWRRQAKHLRQRLKPLRWRLRSLRGAMLMVAHHGAKRVRARVTKVARRQGARLRSLKNRAARTTSRTKNIDSVD